MEPLRLLLLKCVTPGARARAPTRLGPTRRRVAVPSILVGTRRDEILTYHTAIHCHALPYTAIHCHTKSYTAMHCHTLPYTAIHCHTRSYTAMHCHTLPYTAIHCHTLPCTATIPSPDLGPTRRRPRRALCARARGPRSRRSSPSRAAR